MSSRRFSFSNIAWTPHDDPQVFELLRQHGVSGIEIAPTAIWGSWDAMSVDSATQYRRFLQDWGFEVPAMQALLYARPQARLFDPQGEIDLLDHLARVAAIAGALGAKVAVLGAPSQRNRGARSWEQALEQSVPVLRRAAAMFAECGCCLCIEPNAREYGCNFVCTAREGAELVAAVDHPGFGLHLDAGALFLEQEDLRTVLPSVGLLLKHFHVSEPGLGDFRAPRAPHGENLRALDDSGYSGWCSVEMRRPEVPLAEAGPWAFISQARVATHG